MAQARKNLINIPKKLIASRLVSGRISDPKMIFRA
jgi:hypothetical protein